MAFSAAGVAVGSGLQTKVAVINLVCFYLIGLPIGAVLGYVIGLQVEVRKHHFGTDDLEHS